MPWQPCKNHSSHFTWGQQAFCVSLHVSWLSGRCYNILADQYATWQPGKCQPACILRVHIHCDSTWFITAYYNSSAQDILCVQWRIQTVTKQCAEVCVDQDSQYVMWQLMITSSLSFWRCNLVWHPHGCTCMHMLNLPTLVLAAFLSIALAYVLDHLLPAPIPFKWLCLIFHNTSQHLPSSFQKAATAYWSAIS